MRFVTAVVSLATAMLYLLIGVGVLTVVDTSAGAAPSLLEFGLLAGSAYLLGAGLLIAFDRRSLWLLGAVLQVGVIVMYVLVSSQRTPPFELWGLTIKVLQAVILAALLWLSVTAPRTVPRRTQGTRPV